MPSNKVTTYIIIFFLIASASAFTLYLFTLSKQINDLQDSWDRNNQLIMEENRALEMILGQLGYTGYIHNFKNYVLRRDPNYLNKMKTNLAVFETNLDILKAFLLDDSAKAALQDLKNTFDKYQQKSELFKDENNTLSAEELDALVRVDDNRAVMAIQVLMKRIQENNNDNRVTNEISLAQIQNMLLWGNIITFILILQAFAIIYHIRRLQLLNASLAKANQRVDELIKSSPDALLVVDGEGVIVRINDQAEEVFDCEHDQLVGQKVESFIPPAHRQGHEAKRAEFVASGRSIAMSERRDLQAMRRNGETFDVEISLNRISLDDRPAVILNIRDVSQQRKIERAAEHKTKIEALGHLTAGVAHDFNNILTIISGNNELIRYSSEDKLKMIESFIDASDDAITRASGLTSRLLAFGRKQPLVAQEYELKTLLNDLALVLQRTLGETIALKVEVAEEIWPVHIDKAQLESAILNLCLNAKHAMPGGGELLISAENASLDDSFTDEFGNAITGGYVQLSVTDTGTGIDKEVIDKVFEPFFTTKKEGKGSGLGLSMVYGFIKQSHGHIKIYSEVGVGTSVKLFLPTPQKDSVADSDERHHINSVNGQSPEEILQGKTVLVIEDDDDVRVVPATLLRAVNCNVIEAATPEQAIEQAKLHNHIDLVFADVILSSTLNGAQVYDQVKVIRPEAKVLFTTGYANHELLEKVVSVAMHKVLRKPYSRKQLLEECAKVLVS